MTSPYMRTVTFSADLEGEDVGRDAAGFPGEVDGEAVAGAEASGFAFPPRRVECGEEIDFTGCAG